MPPHTQRTPHATRSHHSTLIDLDNPAPSSQCLVDEIINNRDSYLADDASSTILISRFPDTLLSACHTIEAILDTRIGYHGVKLIAVVAMSEGHRLLADDVSVQRLFEVRRKFYNLDRKPVDKFLKREVDSVFARWSLYIKGDNYGGSRKQFNCVPSDIASAIATTADRLAIQSGDFAALCMASCISEQELLSDEMRDSVRELMAPFIMRAEYRIRSLEVLIDMIKETGKRSARIKRSKRGRRRR